MPATPEQWLAALSQTYWTTAGSTGRRTDRQTATRTATRSEAPANVNTKVLDKVREGHEVLARAGRLARQSSPLGHREAAAIRDAFVMEAEELTGDIASVPQRPCPACGCFTLRPVKGKAHCLNRHCAPRPGLRRRWAYRDLAFTKPAAPRGVQRSEGYPADIRPLSFLTEFFAASGHSVPLSTLTRWVKVHNLPRWPVDGSTYAYSLSDVATVHAAQLAARQGQQCGDGAKPACAGLADLFYNADDQAGAMDQKLARRRIAVAKELCQECPFLEPCREFALKPSKRGQHGVAGALTSTERRALKGESR